MMHRGRFETSQPLLNHEKRFGRLRGRATRGAIATCVLFALTFGCASTKQTQYFEVVFEDPDTGEMQTNYYRMTIRGGSYVPWSPSTYKLKAAYLNVETVDVLEGKGPFVPEADLPRAADETYKNVLAEFRKAILERAKNAGGAASAAASGDSNHDSSLNEVARQAWFASMSNGDIVSMGRTRSDDPHVFRKLVFYATAKNLDLQKTIGPQIDSMISKVQTLARREQQRAAARQAQRQGLRRLAHSLPVNSPARTIVDAVFAATAEPSTDDEESSLADQPATPEPAAQPPTPINGVNP